MKAEKELQEPERIDGQVDINENQEYDVLLLEKKGCLNIGGLPDPGVKEIKVKIGELQVDKPGRKEGEYEMKFTSPRSGKIKITIEIENLKNGIRTLSYAPDGLNGRQGGNGGCGGPSVYGMGGKGGDGGDGENGMDGTDCPDVEIVYSSSNGSEVSHMAIPSAGGKGGAGGEGGKGGLCADQKTYAASGSAGRRGRDGKPGGKGNITVRQGGKRHD